MTDQNSAAPDQNSAVEMHYRPDEIQRIFNIKSAQYYERIKFLGIKAHKDEHGKAYLDQSQFERMEKLHQHIQETGKMEGFSDSSSELTIAENAELSSPTPEPVRETVIEDETQLERFIRMAAQLKKQEIIGPHLLVQALASQMTEEDLPEDIKQEIDQVRSSASPKHPSFLANQLLNKWRDQRSQQAAIA